MRILSSSNNLFCVCLLCELCFAAFSIESAGSQVIPDQTLGESSTTIIGDTSDEMVVTGGAQRNTNLFHSFDSFSIDKGQSVFFERPNSVETIFARVIGGEASFINGRLGVRGEADLFFINSAGINFGSNAAIQIRGDFIGTSAQYIKFADGREFTTSENELLSISTPVGLGFLGNSGPIEVENTGHTLTGGSIIFPLVEDRPVVGVSSTSGKIIALFGSDISLVGGVIRAPDGNVTLGAIQEGSVPLSSSGSGFSFTYTEVEELGSVILDRFSLLDAAGKNGGSISVVGQNIQLLDSSVAITSNTEVGNALPSIEVMGQSFLIDGEISKQPSNGVVPTIRPAAPIQFVPASLILDNFSSGSSGTVSIDSSDISMRNGGSIYLRSFGQGVPGDVEIFSDKLSIDGFNSTNELSSSIGIASLGATTSGFKTGGEVLIDSASVAITDGGAITTTTFNQGNGGRVEINSETLRVRSTTERSRIPSQISALSLQIGIFPIVGNGGEVVINTNSLEVSDGGAIGTSTNNAGDAGNLIINARSLVEIDSTVSSSIGPSRIGSNVIQISPLIRELFGLNGVPSGEGGELLINTPKLSIQNGGLIAVRNEGTGGAGDLTLRGSSLAVGEGAEVSASTIQGDGGNINIQFDTVLLSGGKITTTSAESGNGGNVAFDSDVITLVDSSSITANAAQGTGGQISIETSALIQSADSQITATSAAGAELNGVVDIEAQPDTSQYDAELETSLAVPSLALSCINPGEGEGFVITGPGGTSVSSDNTPRFWNGWNRRTGNTTSQPNQASQIVEAQGWNYSENGDVRLVSMAPSSISSTSTPNTDCTNAFSSSVTP